MGAESGISALSRERERMSAVEDKSNCSPPSVIFWSEGEKSMMEGMRRRSGSNGRALRWNCGQSRFGCKFRQASRNSLRGVRIRC